MTATDIEVGRYHNSAQLFQFCKSMLQQKYDGNVRVIDQDVGALLGFDPADCSHWKKGKKHIHNLESIFKIAEQLKIDKDVVYQVALGELRVEEASFAMASYGPFSLDEASREQIKKEQFDRQKSNPETAHQSLKLDLEWLDRLVASVLQKADVREAPVFLGEITSKYPGFRVSHQPSGDYYEVDRLEGPMRVEVRHAEHPIPTHVRYLVVKEFFGYLCQVDSFPEAQGLEKVPQLLEVYRSNFALRVLLPESLLRADLNAGVDADDLIATIAQRFWVAKPLVAYRIKELIARNTRNA
ncbi:MAG: hypothetical protein OXT67_06255 [Zetaproteobacteria bacterium]|nr:hypothetical protein [Zetaproteobacteria bacterium]